MTLLQEVAGAQRSRRARSRHEPPEPKRGLSGAERLEHRLHGATRAQEVDEMVPELGELVEDHVLALGGELGALRVDLSDVALRAGRTDDIAGIGDPPLQPL